MLEPRDSTTPRTCWRSILDSSVWISVLLADSNSRSHLLFGVSSAGKCQEEEHPWCKRILDFLNRIGEPNTTAILALRSHSSSIGAASWLLAVRSVSFFLADGVEGSYRLDFTCV